MATRDVTKELVKILLLTVGVTGLVIAVVAFPGLGHILRVIQKRRVNNYKSYRINQALKRLERQKFISIREDSRKVTIQLLDKGKQRILSYKLEEMQLKKDKWDKVWRIVIFDIPEHKKVAREFLRRKMKNLGFYLLQKSVLVTPWSCQDEIDFIKHYYQIGDYVSLIEAHTFTGEDKVKRYFHLP